MLSGGESHNANVGTQNVKYAFDLLAGDEDLAGWKGTNLDVDGKHTSASFNMSSLLFAIPGLSGGRIITGSGVAPAYDNSCFYSGGTTVPYHAGSRLTDDVIHLMLINGLYATRVVKLVYNFS